MVRRKDEITMFMYSINLWISKIWCVGRVRPKGTSMIILGMNSIWRLKRARYPVHGQY